MLVQLFIAIFVTQSLPGSQKKIKKFLMKTSEEIILSLLHSFFAPGNIVNVKLNPNCLLSWHSWQSSLTY